MDEPMIEDTAEESQENIVQETPLPGIFVAPSVHHKTIHSGDSYSHFSPIPEALRQDMSTECVLGVDEAGRGPVLGPMVYGLFYLPLSQHHSLLAQTHHFDDSKVLTPAVRSSLTQTLCTPSTDLFSTCGWATRVMSARSISSAMLRANSYNLNAQAMDATIDLITHVFSLGINVTEIYIDTIGSPIVYQKKLEKIFPTTRITVAKKADSLYPCVSAASVCAKVTRDAALEVAYEQFVSANAGEAEQARTEAAAWGSGYPSDPRCSSWLKANMDPVFGWGNECRFSWGTAKDMLEAKGAPVKVEWPEPDEDEESMKMTQFFVSTKDEDEQKGGLANWFGRRVTGEVF